ncbi:hypothetical protein BJX61DRAFT_536767 [Aspergillus egyptiacus]|nr:hypothetical protein BJX61DRAFT_536767 [Aspergillus egyptiacus]
MRNNNVFGNSPVWKAQAEGYDWGLQKSQGIFHNTLNNFRMEYARISGTSPEDCVGATWSVILGTIFPAIEGDYAIESQARNPGGYTDFTICDWVGPLRRPFVVVETKKAPKGRRRPGWLSAERQLHRYFRGWAQTARQGETARARCHGAIAIGTQVRFYEYRHETNNIMALEDQDQPYGVNSDAHNIFHHLRYIKNNHH